MNGDMMNVGQTSNMYIMLMTNIFLSNDVLQSAKQKQSLLKFEYALFESKV